MSMWTTSRYAHKETRETARQWARLLDRPYVARGKHTIMQLAAFARRKGENRICVVEEKNNRPAVLSVITVNETGEWERAATWEIQYESEDPVERAV